MALRPVLGAAAVIGFGFVNPSSLPPLIEVGELSLRYVDGVFGLFVCMVLARSVIGRRAAILTEVRELFSPLLLFLFVTSVCLWCWCVFRRRTLSALRLRPTCGCS